ncbi:MAG: DpnD/PcfM family protein [Coriobacteriia bacterium]|nr:DpnD/PcfM family protein [Coriobacteriia bacterium]MCL2536668.1 DpnD/PcfM family protein [Coriobacteriia bacterium]
MKEYEIIIEETISEAFTVIAQSPEEALDIARQKYRDCEFVLEPGNITSSQMAVANNNELEWHEL